MECAYCGYIMDAFEKECPRCAKYGVRAVEKTQHPLPVQAPETHTTKNTTHAGHCLICGMEIPMNALGCPNCDGIAPRGEQQAAFSRNSITNATSNPQYCRQCRQQLPSTASFCSTCGFVTGHEVNALVSTNVTIDSNRQKQYTWPPILATLADPYDGMGLTEEEVAPNQMLLAGISIITVYFLSYFLMILFIANQFPYFDFIFKQKPFEISGHILLLICLPFAAFLISCMLARILFSGEGTLKSDTYIVGISFLPFYFFSLAILFIDFFLSDIPDHQLFSNLISSTLVIQIIIVVLLIVSMCHVILLLFSGYIHLSNLTTKAATVAVPMTIICSLAFTALSYYLYSLLLKQLFLSNMMSYLFTGTTLC